MNKQKFEVRFDKDAAKEYQRLDGSIIDAVDKAIDELEYRADEIGKPLGNKRDTKLAGCKEIKLRELGIRIVFRVTNEVIDILQVVYVLTIEKRNKDFVFKQASKRYKQLKRQDIDKLLASSKKWPVENKKK